MTGTRASAGPAAAARREDRTRRLGLARGCETALDLTVVVLATWTVVYHVCLLLRLSVPWAVGLEVFALAGWGFLSRRGRRQSAGALRSPTGSTQGPQTTRAAEGRSAATGSSTGARLLVATVTSGLAAAVLVAVSASWPAVAAMWLTAAISGTAWAVLRLGQSAVVEFAGQEIDDDREAEQPAGAGVALVWGIALAVLSMFTVGPDSDDLFYVNLSQWVVDHGTFPLRDTIFSDLVFPMSSWPPVASYDALAGTLARLAGVPAASVVYLVVPPAATLLSVLALWRLLSAWRVEAIGVALSVGLVFLLFDGGPGYAAPGNLFLTRIWQGKVILCCLVVPLLLFYALRYVERPTMGHGWWLFAGGVAAAGLSTSAMFLVPLIALAGVIPLCWRRPGMALAGFVAMAAYPLATGVVTVAVGGHSADLFGSRALWRFDPAWFGHEIFRDGLVAAIAVAAVLAGALLVPARDARVTTGALAVITGVTFVPGVTHLSYDLIGLGPTLWRVSWVASIAALVGVLGARLATYRTHAALSVAGPVALVAVLILFGTPLWSCESGVALSRGLQWKRAPDTVVAAKQAISAARPGDLILAPRSLAITIDVLTTRVKTVATRDYFMEYLRDDPSFQFAERLSLFDFANLLAPRGYEPKVAHALTQLDVDEVCLPVESHDYIRFLRGEGYRPVTTSGSYNCFTR